jgi:hypothetical protein
MGLATADRQPAYFNPGAIVTMLQITEAGRKAITDRQGRVRTASCLSDRETPPLLSVAPLYPDAPFHSSPSAHRRCANFRTDTAYHAWIITPTPNGVHLSTDETMQGPR